MINAELYNSQLSAFQGILDQHITRYSNQSRVARFSPKYHQGHQRSIEEAKELYKWSLIWVTGSGAQVTPDLFLRFHSSLSVLKYQYSIGYDVSEGMRAPMSLESYKVFSMYLEELLKSSSRCIQ